MFQFITIYLLKGDEIVRACDRHSNETVTLRKHVTKYKKMRKLMVEFYESLSLGETPTQIKKCTYTKHNEHIVNILLFGLNLLQGTLKKRLSLSAQ